MKAYIGIDLGTTNTTCSIVSAPDQGTPISLKLTIEQAVFFSSDKIAYESNDILPSCVIVSEKSNKIYCGRMDDNNISTDFYAIRNIKTKLSDNLWNAKSKNKNLTPVLISAVILRTIYLSIEKQFKVTDVEKIVITIPASFSSKMRRATIDAAIIAGFPESKVSLLDEPIAAIMSSFDLSNKSFITIPDNEKFLVFDMGGGTTDVSILQIDKHKKLIKVISSSRYNELGGNDIDFELAALILAEISNTIDTHSIFDEIQKNRIRAKQFATAVLRKGCELKEEINRNIQSLKTRSLTLDELVTAIDDKIIIKVDLNDFPEFLGKSISLPLRHLVKSLLQFISYSNMENENRNIFKPLQEALDKKGIKISEINGEFMVGGSSRFSLIRIALKDRLREISDIFDPIYSISEGAAKFAYLKENEGWDILERTTEKIYLQTNDSIPIEILTDNLPIPCTMQEPKKALEGNNTIYIEEEENQLEIEFYQGMSDSDIGRSLLHRETITLESEIFTRGKMTGLIGCIDSNKVYNFLIHITEDGETIIKKQIVFGSTYNEKFGDIDLQSFSGLVINEIVYE